MLRGENVTSEEHVCEKREVLMTSQHCSPWGSRFYLRWEGGLCFWHDMNLHVTSSQKWSGHVFTR